jgi:hypothetical protein
MGERKKEKNENKVIYYLWPSAITQSLFAFRSSCNGNNIRIYRTFSALLIILIERTNI